MKVVVITHNYIRRQGDLTALYLHRLASGLMARGLDITVICPHAPGLLRNDNIDGVKIIRIAYPLSNRRPIVYAGDMHEQVAASPLAKFAFAGLVYSFYKNALSVCRREKVDLIWANWWIPPGLAAARVAHKLRLPLVISSHGSDIGLLSRGGLAGMLSRRVYRRTRKATVVSSFLKERLLSCVDTIAADDVVVIPMPVGMEQFPRTAPVESETPMFLSVARYTRQKRLDDIICAAERLAAEGLPFRVKMVGEGPLRETLQRMVDEKGLGGRFDIGPLVAQQKLGELYRQCHGVLLVSEGEGFGLVLVEAGLTGRGVIAARSGGITDVITDGVNGLLIEPGDIDALTAAMRTFITDAAMRNGLGDGGYKIAMEKFATPVLVDRVHSLFMSLVPGDAETDNA